MFLLYLKVRLVSSTDLWYMCTGIVTEMKTLTRFLWLTPLSDPLLFYIYSFFLSFIFSSLFLVGAWCGNKLRMSAQTSLSPTQNQPHTFPGWLGAHEAQRCPNHFICLLSIWRCISSILRLSCIVRAPQTIMQPCRGPSFPLPIPVTLAVILLFTPHNSYP